MKINWDCKSIHEINIRKFFYTVPSTANSVKVLLTHCSTWDFGLIWSFFFFLDSIRVHFMLLCPIRARTSDWASRLCIGEASCHATEAINLSWASGLIASCPRRPYKWTTEWVWHQPPGRRAVSQVIDRRAGDSQQLKAKKETADCSPRRDRGTSTSCRPSRLMMAANTPHTRIDQPCIMSAQHY